MTIVEIKHKIGSIRGKEYHARGIYFFQKVSIGFLYPMSAVHPDKPYQRYVFCGEVNGNLVGRILWFGCSIKGWYYNEVS